MTLLLTEQDVRATVTYDDLYRELERCLGGWHSAGTRHRARVRVGTRATGLNVLAGADAGAGHVGVKAYSAHGRGRDHVVLLYDDADGSLAAIVAAEQLGALRTGALSAIATRRLHGDTEVLAIIGSGGQAVTQARAIAADNAALAEIRVHSRDEANRQRCTDLLDEQLRAHGCTVRAVSTTSAACADADVVCTATTASTPVLTSEHVAPGAHVNAAGSNGLSRVEIDPGLLVRAAVIVDSREQASREAGDLLALVESGRLDWQQLPELGDVVAAGRAPLPVGDAVAADVTVFESLGVGTYDVTAAALALRVARQRGLGSPIDLS